MEFKIGNVGSQKEFNEFLFGDDDIYKYDKDGNLTGIVCGETIIPVSKGDRVSVKKTVDKIIVKINGKKTVINDGKIVEK